MTKIPFIIVIKDGVVDTVIQTDETACEKDFFEAVKQKISNWDEYTQEDRDAILKQGYERFGNGSICLTWIDITTPPLVIKPW